LGKEYVPPPSEKEKDKKGKGAGAKGSKSIAEKRAESKSWKLGGTVLTEEELSGVKREAKGPSSYLSISWPLVSSHSGHRRLKASKEKKEAALL
jgi:hypothetical protein